MTTARLGLISAGVAALCVLATADPAAAQHVAHLNAPVPHVRPSAHHATPAHPVPSAENERRENPRHFRGVASRLNETPEAMEEAFEAARQANHRLSRGQFIAANMLAHDLGARHPGVTTQAILDGLKNGQSIGRTLQSLGLSHREAKQAEKAADREVKEADKAMKDADRDRDRTPDTH
jgi:hypothetical protein